MGDSGQNLRPLLEMILNALLHGIKSPRCLANLHRPLFSQGGRLAAGGLQGIHRTGKAGKRAHHLAHRQPRAERHQDELQNKYHRQPTGHRRHARDKIEG